LPFAVAFSMPFQAGEELGWRGFALPRLAERFGAARASLVLGVIWAFWHLPQFYIQGADTLGQSFLVWAPQVVTISLALRARQRQPMAPNADALGNQQHRGHCAVPVAGLLWMLAALFLRTMSPPASRPALQRRS
jgi:membrane protease YdiL (CAAX protease family)